MQAHERSSRPRIRSGLGEAGGEPIYGQAQGLRMGRLPRSLPSNPFIPDPWFSLGNRTYKVGVTEEPQQISLLRRDKGILALALDCWGSSLTPARSARAGRTGSCGCRLRKTPVLTRQTISVPLGVGRNPSGHPNRAESFKIALTGQLLKNHTNRREVPIGVDNLIRADLRDS